jgi:hypothetical protein
MVIENFEVYIILKKNKNYFSFLRNYASNKLIGTTTTCNIVAALSLPVT